MSKSPYVTDVNRLADVIAAIQALGIYPFHMRTFDDWAESISGDRAKGSYWRAIFEEHPEFFRLDTSRTLASLVWRRQFPKRYNVDQGRELNDTELQLMSDQDRTRLSRRPLAPTDISALINAAISCHSRAVELHREIRWWLPLITSALGGLLGGALGALGTIASNGSQ